VLRRARGAWLSAVVVRRRAVRRSGAGARARQLRARQSALHQAGEAGRQHPGPAHRESQDAAQRAVWRGSLAGHLDQPGGRDGRDLRTAHHERNVMAASREALEAEQLERLQWSIAHAYDNTSYYRAKCDAIGVIPDDLKSLADLARFPFILKSDFRENYPFGM